MLKIALIGVCSVLMAINVKSLKSEYGLYIAFVACLVIGDYGLCLTGTFVEAINKITSYVSGGKGYAMILIKIAGITYLSDFASSLCQDAGYGAVASQIEFVAKLTVLCMSIPVMMGLIEIIDGM